MKNLNVAIPTPFSEDENLQVHKFKPIIDYLTNNGIDSLLVSGTAGEQHAMTINERLQIIDYFNEQNFHDVELIFGVSATRTADAVRLVKALENSVFHVILIGFPPYIKPTQAQAVAYVEDLLKHTTKNVALYNNPPRTGFDLSAEAFKSILHRNSNIVGLKEGGDVDRHKNTSMPEGFLMFAAGDVAFPEKIKRGCNGLSSMVGNVYPKEMKDMFERQLMHHKEENAHKLDEYIQALTIEKMIPNIKNHYNQLGIKAGVCRAPIS